MRKHSKGCVCKACCYLRLNSPKAPDPAQLGLLEAVESASSSVRARLFPDPAEKKKAVLEAHDQRHRETLAWLRNELRKIYHERAKGGLPFSSPWVTADDAARLLENHPEKDPDGPNRAAPRSWLGALFRGKEWEFTGQLVPSVRAGNNGRAQRAWRYVGD